MSFSKYIKDLRLENNLTQKELSKILGISPTALVNIEAARTKYPNSNVYNKLVKYTGKNYYNIAYDFLFNNELSDYGLELPEHYKRYLAYIFSFSYIIDINNEFPSTYENNHLFAAVVWRVDFNYYKMIIAYYRREKFLAAIKNLNKDKNSLEKLIFEETLFFEQLSFNKQIKEIRFVLDKSNSDDLVIFDYLKNIKISNIGKLADVSFELFDTTSTQRHSKNRIYVTNRNSHIGI